MNEIKLYNVLPNSIKSEHAIKIIGEKVKEFLNGVLHWQTVNML